MTRKNSARAIRSSGARKKRLPCGATRHSRRQELLRLLEEKVWLAIPSSLLGKRLPRREKERILGYGRYGV